MMVVFTFSYVLAISDRDSSKLYTSAHDTAHVVITEDAFAFYEIRVSEAAERDIKIQRQQIVNVNVQAPTQGRKEGGKRE